MQLANELSEMMSDMLGQWRRRTIAASSRRQTATTSVRNDHTSLLRGGDVGEDPMDDKEGGSILRGEGIDMKANASSPFLPILSTSFPVSSQSSDNHVDPKRSEKYRGHRSISRRSSKIADTQAGNHASSKASSRNVTSGSSIISSSNKSVKSSRRRSSNKVLYSKSNSCANSSKSVHGFNLVSVILAQTLILMCSVCCSSKVYNVHWNTSNPIFRIDNTDHIIDVNRDNLPYDQVNIICPVYQPGTKEEDAEKYIIYNVSKEEYDTCRITNPNPRIIAVCDKPFKLMYFTITFRSFTPQPGGLEFRPGQDYYFISTSSRDDLHRRVGGRCSTHNMKVVFKVCCHPGETSSQSSTSAPALPQNPRYSTPRASTASSATLSPRRPQIVYNSSSSASSNNPNINIYGRISNGSNIITNNDHYYQRTQDPLYNSNNILGGSSGGGGSSSSSSSPTSTSTTKLPPQTSQDHPPVTRYPPKKTQYSNNPNYKPPSKKKELEKHPNEVVKNEELTSGAASSSLTALQITTLLFFTLSTILVTRRIQSPAFQWSVR